MHKIKDEIIEGVCFDGSVWLTRSLYFGIHVVLTAEMTS